MDELEQRLDAYIDRLGNAAEFRVALQALRSVYPFNRFEYAVAHLLAAQKLSLQEYLDLRDEYMVRNQYLYVFEMSSPRGFGETWAQTYIRQFAPNLLHPNNTLDPTYDGEYDLFLAPAIRIEVKASRAVAAGRGGPLYIKALSIDSAEPFDMNLQQIKPACCDVLVWVAVWRDAVRCWALASSEVAQSLYYSKGQHRGNVGEGQLHLTQDNIHAFDAYAAELASIEQAIRDAYARGRGPSAAAPL